MTQMELPLKEETNPLKVIATLANKLVELRTHEEGLEEQLKNLADEIKHIEEVLLPQIMMENEIASYTTVTGEIVSLTDVIGASIKDKETAFAWLRETNNSAIIKNQIAVDLARGQDRLATQIIDSLTAQGLEVSYKETVHPQTLKAFIKELLEKGVDFPREAFGLFENKKVTIKNR